MTQPGRAPAAAERSPHRWLLLGLLITGMFFCYAHRSTLGVAAPFMVKQLGLGPTTMGVLLSAFFWSYSLAQVPAGWIVDRYGVGPAYAGGFLIWTIAVVLTGLAATLPLLIAARIVMGLGQSVAFPASARAVANAFPAKERGGATGLYLSGNRIGQAVVSAVGPVAVVTWGWRGFFIASGLLGFVWLAAWIPSSKKLEPRPVAASGAPRASVSQFLPLLRDRRIAGIFCGFFTFDYVWYVFLTWMPSYLILERKFSPRDAGIYGSVPFLIVAVVIVAAGMLGDLLVRSGWRDVTARRTLITAGMLIACLIVPAGFVEDRIVSAWLLAASICGLGLASPNIWALTQTVCAKEVVATASGIQNLGGNLGGVLAPILTGLIADATGSFAMAFVVAGVLLLGGMACYWLLIPDRSPQPRDPQSRAPSTPPSHSVA